MAVTSNINHAIEFPIQCLSFMKLVDSCVPNAHISNWTDIRGPWHAKVTGIGSAYPIMEITNLDLEKIVNTTHEWIKSRTGIERRRILGVKETIHHLAALASIRALINANIEAAEVDLIILATSCQTDAFGDASFVAKLIGAKNAAAWDLTAACAGFSFAMINASVTLHSHAFNTILVIGSDCLSQYVNWEDRNTCVLFGDAAGAIVMQPSRSNHDAALLSFVMMTDYDGRTCLNLPRESRHNFNNSCRSYIEMDGREVYKLVATRIPGAIEKALEYAGLRPENIDWLLLHQANVRLMEVVASKLKIDANKVIRNIDKYGNTSAASIPLALDEAVKSRKLNFNDIIVIAGYGAGFSWGVIVLKWTGNQYAN